MEGAGKLVTDDELAEAMKERGLGTPATRADTIEGLINQKYLDRAQRELIPTTKAEQLFQFLSAVKVENLTSPTMTGEWEYHLREMEHGKFSREKFMAEIVKETKGIVERVKGFEEDDSVARETDIISPTDNKPMKETLRGYKSQDGELMVYKIVGGRRMEEAEVKQLVESRQVGPLDGFISNKTRNRFSAVLKLEVVEETKKDKATKQDVTTKKWKTAFDFGDKVDIGTLTPFWTDPKTGAELCESGSSFIVREKLPDGSWEQTFRVGRIMCQKPIPPEQAIKLIGEGKTDLIENFISKKGRPFSAFLKRDGGKFSWEFPPRAAKLDKDGKPIVRKAKAKADLSKAKVIGESKIHTGGQLVELGDAYYVRKPDQDNREVFKLSKKLCEVELPAAQVQKLLTDGRSDLIEGFVSKRGNKFSAYLVISQKQDKADFEFPPR
jgi:DNA topoisomerase-3